MFWKLWVFLLVVKFVISIYSRLCPISFSRSSWLNSSNISLLYVNYTSRVLNGQCLTLIVLRWSGRLILLFTALRIGIILVFWRLSFNLKLSPNLLKVFMEWISVAMSVRKKVVPFAIRLILNSSFLICIPLMF